MVFDEIFRQPYYHPRQCIIDFAGASGFLVGEGSALWLTDLVIVDALHGEVVPARKTAQSVPLPPQATSTPTDTAVNQARRLLAGSRGLVNVQGPAQTKVTPEQVELAGGALEVDIFARAYSKRVLFFDNYATNGGAGAFRQDSYGQFNNCTFLYNAASGLGGKPPPASTCPSHQITPFQ